MEGESHKNRRQHILETGQEFDYVPTDGIENICEFMVKAGFATSTRGGLEPFTPADIMGWREMLEMDLDPDECRMIMGLSRIFVNDHHLYDKNNRARFCPYEVHLKALKKQEEAE